MARKKNHTCIVCGKEYDSCDSCEQIKTYTPWRTIACSPTCFSQYLTVKSLDAGLIDLKTAKAELKQNGVTAETLKTLKLTDGARTRFTEILGASKEPKKETKKSSETK